MPLVVLPKDVEALQKIVRADFDAVRTALQRCASSGTFTPDKTPGDWLAWQSLKARTEAFLAESSSFLSSAPQYERGEAVQKELAPWHDKARALGCDAGPAAAVPGAGGFGLSSLFAGMSTTALLVLAALFLLKSK